MAMNKFSAAARLPGLLLAWSFALTSCEQPMISPGVDPQELPQQPRGDDYGISHDDFLNNVGDVFKDGRQVSPAEGEKLHACGKLRYATFVNILRSRSLNVDNTTAGSVGALLTRARPVCGVPNFGARVGETTRNSTSSLVSLEDILIAMAEELLPSTNPEGRFSTGACQGSTLFDLAGCNRDGLACLLGSSPTQRQLDLCNNMVGDAGTGVADELTRKRLTVAAMAGVAFLCE